MTIDGLRGKVRLAIGPDPKGAPANLPPHALDLRSQPPMIIGPAELSASERASSIGDPS